MAYKNDSAEQEFQERVVTINVYPRPLRADAYTSSPLLWLLATVKAESASV
mgnify:CR=1 FL=1